MGKRLTRRNSAWHVFGVAHVLIKEECVRHPNPTVVLVLATREVRRIRSGSYAARFACSEAISLDPHGRETDAEVYCEDRAREVVLTWRGAIPA